MKPKTDSGHRPAPGPRRAHGPRSVPGAAPSLRIRLLDVHILNVQPLEDQAVVVFAILSDTNAMKYPGSITLPFRVITELKLQVGDELTILVQKSLSQHHIGEDTR